MLRQLNLVMEKIFALRCLRWVCRGTKKTTKRWGY